MAGHSQFANIKHRKEAKDKKKGKIFSRLVREITVAARAGLPDPNHNARLRAAVQAATAANMPKDNVQRAIDKAAGAMDGQQLEEIRYEGYGPAGVAIIVEAVTDNKNRTASDVRSTFTKFGGNLGETGSVAFMFDRLGSLTYPAAKGNADTLFEAALDAGADDVVSEEDTHHIFCAPDDFNKVMEKMAARFGQPDTSGIDWRPKTVLDVPDDKAESLLRLMDALDDLDDVQNVAANFRVSDHQMQKYAEKFAAA